MPTRSFGVHRTLALDRYERPIGDVLGRAKATADRRLARELAELYADGLHPALRGLRIDAVVPAPSSLKTRWTRGFSVASLFATAIARRVGRPVVDALVSRVPVRLATLTAASRRAAVRGRIRSVRDVPGGVLLVDDVVTTGATAEAAATELLGGASDRVVLATLCAVTHRATLRPSRIWTGP